MSETGGRASRRLLINTAVLVTLVAAGMVLFFVFGRRVVPLL